MRIKYFSQPEVLQQIGHVRLPMFLAAFGDEVKAANLLLPEAPDPNELRIPNPPPESAQAIYFKSLAAIFSSAGSLPEGLYAMLLTLEAAASPENDGCVREIFFRRMSCYSMSPHPVDRALDIWFICPEELQVFQTRNGAPHLPSDGLSAEEDRCFGSKDTAPESRDGSVPWPTAVNGALLLNALTAQLKRFVVLPWLAAEALALWIVHTYAFRLREVTAYIGIESPEKRCGKTTLLTVLNELAHHALAAANITPPAFFRVIDDMSPTLLIDEADTFLNANITLKGILNAGYKKKTAFVFRAAPAENATASEEQKYGESVGTAAANDVQVKRFSTWCPKAIATIDRLPDTLADRCILIRMHRKTADEECERLRALDGDPLRCQCARFVQDHANEIASAAPLLPAGLSDRAADIWEPLLAIADLAGGDWPKLAREAAVRLSAAAQETNPIGSLLLDLFILFFMKKADRLLSRELVEGLNEFEDRPWMSLLNGKVATERWLAEQLRPYGIKPRTMRVGEEVARGYVREDFTEVFRRYIPKSEIDVLMRNHEDELNP